MLDLESLPDDFFVTHNQFTKKVHRDVYPAIDPAQADLSQAGKVIVITGANRPTGIGKLGFAAAFARAHPKAIVISGRKVEELKGTEDLIKSIDSNIEVLALPLEVTSAASAAKFFEKVKNRFGAADVLVNNAGVQKAFQETIKDGNLDVWWSDIETNLKGSAIVTQHFLKLLGPDQTATVVNLTSGAARAAIPAASGYGLSKLGDLQLTAYITAENPNVTSFALDPGVVLTDMHSEMRAFRKFAKDTPDLVGSVGVWLTSNQAKFMNGRYISINWDVEELVARQEEIVSGNLLTLTLSGQFGDATLQT